ncbi:hypothetical protein O6H91_20G018900 [Diphasiastrum complanatum]|uniref:Uncharacterized protein n=1 Tax=Diphasiastrum complanatum TaxID=34168 RepID=A0ACC2AN53_DIPCM|nr:hypothetical protein O6H91_20G018900 [Diphasiastrum complanatum]
MEDSAAASARSLKMACNSSGSGCDSLIAQAVDACPFLRNIGEPTLFSFSDFPRYSPPSQIQGVRGPIFEDGPDFEAAFRLFHGRNGIIPLSERSAARFISTPSFQTTSEIPRADIHPLAASAATISLSAFGAGGAFNFDAFMAKKNAAGKKQPPKKKPDCDKNSKAKTNANGQGHEASGIDWLETGNCPIAKSYRAVSGVLPLVAKLLQPPPGMKFRCPPAIVAARAAIAKTALAKSLRPQPLPSKVLAIGLLGMAVNVPLGVWREHTEKFSLAWFVVVHASVPFIGMLRKAVHMPKYAMAFTIASAILGQVIGSRAERVRVAGINNVTAMANIHKVLEHVDGSDSPEMLPVSVKGIYPVGLKKGEPDVRVDACSSQFRNEVWIKPETNTSSSLVEAC